MRALNPNKNAATGSTGEAAIFLSFSIIAMIAAVTISYLGVIYETAAAWGVAALFLVWLSGTTFTLGILEYRRAQAPAQLDHGPEV